MDSTWNVHELSEHYHLPVFMSISSEKLRKVPSSITTFNHRNHQSIFGFVTPAEILALKASTAQLTGQQ